MSSSPRRAALLSVVALSTAAVLGLAAPASAADVATYPLEVLPGLTVIEAFPNYVIAVDCDEWVGAGDYGPLELTWVPGGSLDVLLSCDPAGIDGFAVDPDLVAEFPPFLDAQGPVPGYFQSYSLDPNTGVVFDFLAPAEIEIDYNATLEIDDPAGSRLFEETLAIPAGGTQVANFSDECGDDEGSRVYETLVVTVLTSGEFTFRVVGVTPLQSGEYLESEDEWFSYDPNPWGDYVPIIDPVVAVYSTFNPADTDAGRVDCNDDTEADDFPSNGDAYDSEGRLIDALYSELTLDLAPGTYTVLLTTYDYIGADLILTSAKDSLDTDVPSFAPAVYTATDLPEQTGTVEIWGQDGGLVLGAQLAATGPSQPALGVLATFAALFVLAGASVVAVRRRV